MTEPTSAWEFAGQTLTVLLMVAGVLALLNAPLKAVMRKLKKIKEGCKTTRISKRTKRLNLAPYERTGI